jgi:hypothetical protein
MYQTDTFQFCRPYIVAGESVLWKGRPEKGNIFTRKELVLLPFSLMICGFSLFWEYMALQSGQPFVILWGLPFVAIGIYMLIGRYIQAAFLRDKTFYVITNKKLIIKKGNRIHMYQACDLPPMEVEIHKNGNGTILFCEEVYTRRGRRHSTYIALENLKDIALAQNAVSMMEN